MNNKFKIAKAYTYVKHEETHNIELQAQDNTQNIRYM